MMMLMIQVTPTLTQRMNHKSCEPKGGSIDGGTVVEMNESFLHPLPCFGLLAVCLQEFSCSFPFSCWGFAITCFVLMRWDIPNVQFFLLEEAERD